MHDLNTINKLNQKAFEDSVTKLQAEGKFVVALYAGLSLIGIEPFDDEPAARAFIAGNDEDPSARAFLLSPITNAAEKAAIRGRDQSEDRTLGDYIGRKEA